jgi:hypothetical protein
MRRHHRVVRYRWPGGQRNGATLKARLAGDWTTCAQTLILSHGMGCHSMAAAQTMMEAGANGRVPYQQGSQRFDAYIAVSPQWPDSRAFDELNAWSGAAAPVLVLTRTEDSGFDGTTPQSRILVFALLPPGQKRLGVVVWADHIELGRRRSSSEGEVAAAIAGEFLVQ